MVRSTVSKVKRFKRGIDEFTVRLRPTAHSVCHSSSHWTSFPSHKLTPIVPWQVDRGRRCVLLDELVQCGIGCPIGTITHLENYLALVVVAAAKTHM